MLPESLQKRLRHRMDELRVAHEFRAPPLVRFTRSPSYIANQQELVSFCSNDYLGFAGEPLTVQVSRSGAGASRLIHGDHQQLRELEQRFAQTLGYPDAILCQSGYLANLLTLSQLPQLGPSIFYSDQYNHRSIIDALSLGKADKHILPHLESPAQAPGNWWVCESRYSMDGDTPAAASIEEHLDQQGLVYLDEAHRFGLESQGRGLAQQLQEKPTLCNLPLGKSYGMQGAVILGDALLLDWLRQVSKAYIYTTALSPVLTQAIEQRFEPFFGDEGQARREQLRHNLRLASEYLQRNIEGPITPIPMPDNETALQASQRLREAGLHVQAIRPPTVPKGQSRLRITWSCTHTPKQIQRLAHALEREGILGHQGSAASTNPNP